MSGLWLKSSGETLATLQERRTTTVNLPLTEPSATTTLISGQLPSGMRLDSNQITGTPFEVPRETTFTFVIRASFNGTISDRTFKIIIQGADAPTWVTAEDLLPVGINGQYFILDSAPIDFQLEATDQDTATGQTLEYFIGNRDGELPPGIQLTKDGRLIGVVDPILAIEKAASNGYYDDAPFDYLAKIGYDWSVRSNNGYDSYFYDTTTYDFNTPTRSPKKLNRYYQFTVNVSDGDTITRRTFRIYVVGDDFFRADTTVMQVGTGVFTADVTHVRTPIWVTPRDFGFRRANNYLTLKLDVIDPNSLTGVVVYNLASKNDDGTDSTLPPGLTIDSTNGEIAGYTPYQPAVTKEYKFTVNARRIDSRFDTIQFQQFAYENTAKNSINLKINKLGQYSSDAIGKEFTINGIAYKVDSISTVNSLYDILELDKALQVDIKQGDTIDLGLVNVAATEVAEKSKTFVVKLIGEIDSTIQWITPENLGDISANYISTLSVIAQTTVPNARLIYTVESGKLPPGLSLSLDGEIIGKIRSFGTGENLGLTVFDNQEFSLDGNTTTVDRKFSFNIKAQDQFGYSAIQRNFTITVSDPGNKQFSNIYAQPFMSETKRQTYVDLINNAEIFNPDYIYRPNDPNFGLQRKLKMLVYSGIETKNIEEYVAAAAKNHTRKQLKLGEIKTAIAKTPGTNDIVYELLYIEVIDPYESSSGDVKKQIKIKNKAPQLVNNVKFTLANDLYDALPNVTKITLRNGDTIADVDFSTSFDLFLRTYKVTYPVSTTLLVTLRDGSEVEIPFTTGTPSSKKYRPEPANAITADTDALTADGAADDVRYISNISHMRDAIKGLGETERNFLPLWMRTAQAGSVNELGFVNAIPLVYCKPGTSAIVKNSLDFVNPDFTQFNFDMDRYIIDSTTGNSEEQYILFANYKFNI